VHHRVCEEIEDASAFLRTRAGAPIVLKPHAGGLSDGVYVVRTEDELAERWAGTRRATAGLVLAEEYLTGPEFSVESISLAGRHEVVAITEKVTTPPPGFVELGHQVPAALDDVDAKAITELVVALLDLVGQQTGPCHTEVRLTPDGPRIIESQTRFGGDQIWEMCELVTGVDLMSETFASLLGIPAPVRRPQVQAAAIRFFAHENVRVVADPDVSSVAAAQEVVRLVCSLRAGQELGELTSSDSRQGYVLATGANLEVAVAAAERARDGLAVGLEPLPG
jgi:biotin carboxylase